MDIQATIKAFKENPTLFLCNWPKLYKLLLKIVKERKLDGWVKEAPL